MLLCWLPAWTTPLQLRPCCCIVMQTGVGALTPNDFASIPSVVRYGTSATALSQTATGNAEVRRILLWVTIDMGTIHL